MARWCLVCFGILLLAGAVLWLVMPDLMDSGEGSSHPRGVDEMIKLGTIGYGLLLILPPRALARSRAVTLTLVGVMLAYCAGIFMGGLARGSIVQACFGVVVRSWPAAIAIAMMIAESRHPKSPQQRTSAPSGARR